MTIEFTEFDVLGEPSIRSLMAEASRAHAKHKAKGGSLLDPGLDTLERLAALMEEVGEVAQELTHDHDTSAREWRVMVELIQVANVAMTWYEFMRRRTITGMTSNG